MSLLSYVSRLSSMIAVATVVAGAQTHETARGSSVVLGGSATGIMTRVSPAIMGRALTEGYITQPFLFAHLALPRNTLALHAMVNFEGITLERGELNPGIYGEGYVDRRHPHTYLHELMFATEWNARSADLSIAAGKGFAPFGTDDPMSRPLVKYPVNHHLAQILERIVAVAALRMRYGAVEAGLFNGDEPESSGDAPNTARRWDSWAVRGTALPIPGAELQASYARVSSPEHATGEGLDHRKKSASLRYESGATITRRYALLEWANTVEYLAGEATFAFKSLLGEGEVRWRRGALALRIERTERPDEERLLDPFRTPRPGSDFNILGRSRWTVVSARGSSPLELPRRRRIEPFVEISRVAVVQTVAPAAFEPNLFYGGDRLWSLSAGIRLGLGARHGRMGRYGVAIAPSRGTTIDPPGHDHTH